ncbi:MAG: phage tail protein [Ignavibacteria bacterium]
MDSFPKFPSMPEPSSPKFPQNMLTKSISLIMPGTITAFCGPINYDTYELENSNKLLRMNFSPTVKNSTGWILCNGGNTNINVFPALFETIGYLYGKGDKSNEFKVPNYTGYFLRALALNDNVDKGFGEREKNPANGSSGTKDGVGSIQQNMVQEHKHKYTNYSDLKTKQLGPGDAPTNGPNPNVYTEADIYSASQEKLSGNETRPVNMYVNYLIYSGFPASINK